MEHTPVILIAANPEQRHPLCALLDDYSIIEAGNNADVLPLISCKKPDLVFIDTCSDFDALDLCARISRDTPVLLALEREDERLVKQGFDCGMTDYVCYPIRPVVLRHRIQQLLQIQSLQHRLHKKNERYQLISNIISDYAYAYRIFPDGTFGLEWSTRAVEAISGYTAEELKGDGWLNLVHPDDRHIMIARSQRLERGEQDISEYRIITREGRIHWLHDYGCPIMENGRLVMVYGASQDITERRYTEDMLRSQAGELQKRNEELDAFAHTVAHDLKNPVSSMLGFASLVLHYYDRMTDDKIREYLSLIMESGYKLKDMINSLLLLAGVNRAPVQFEPLHMDAIVEGAKSRLIGLIEESHAQIIQPDDWPVALGYAPWVEEIWANYLSNALKYGGTPPCIRVGADVATDGKVRFWIADNGAGISETDQSKLFTPFTRLIKSKTEGHGLGLSVVLRIVEKLGGEVGVNSLVGQGSVFSFTLPTP